jgi:tetraacyldisaccharide 4'-kinase
MKEILLSPFGLLYGAVVRARTALYEKDIFKSHSLGAVTVSIGNITVGGTGKTPLVAYVARILAGTGERVGILTRGYKRENPRERVLVSDGEKIFTDVKKAGDEPFELAGKLLGFAAVIADANRVEAGKWARRNLGITAFVLDDAFQHLRVKRDLDIVCIDATNPFGSGKVLPKGILREPLSNLERADAVVITRANLIAENQIENLKLRIAKINPRAKIFVSENRISDLINLSEYNAERKSQISNFEFQKTNNRFFAFCALGNPENFFEQLRRENFDLISTKAFRDHHNYDQQDIERLENNANGADAFLTTAKDAVKLKDLRFNLPCYVVESEMSFEDEEGFRRMIKEAVSITNS